eukprot:COSAG05_NODE_5731_length_1103_cov_1.136454_1_plen_321_part_10
MALVEKGEQSMPGVSKKVTVPGLTLFYYSEWKHTAAHKAWKARWADRSRDECQACHKGGRLITCDKCPASWHPRCHGFASWDAALEELGPKGAWTCQLCTEEGAGPNPPFTPTDEPGGATAASGGGKKRPASAKAGEAKPAAKKPQTTAGGSSKPPQRWKNPQEIVGKRVRANDGRVGKVLSTSHGFFSVKLERGGTVNLRGAVLSLIVEAKSSAGSKRPAPRSSTGSSNSGGGGPPAKKPGLACPHCRRIFTHPPALAVHRKACGDEGNSMPSSKKSDGNSPRPSSSPSSSTSLSGGGKASQLSGGGNKAPPASSSGGGA